MYNCKYCGKEFTTRNLLASHTRFCDSNPCKTTNTQYQCQFCGRISVGIDKLHNHENHCNFNPNKKVRKNSSKNLNYKPSDYNKEREYFCSYCGKVCKNLNSLKNHEIRCKSNTNRIVMRRPVEFTFKGRIPYNKGLTKDTDERVYKNATAVKEYYKYHDSPFKGKHHTEESKRLLSVKMTEVNHECHNRYSWGKKGWYDGVFFMSTYELVYYIYMRDTGSNIVRCKQRFKYFYEDKYHYYTPDFILNNNTFVEVKGLERAVDKIKYSVVPGLLVVKYDVLSPMIHYVKTTYNVVEVEQLYDKAY